MTIQSPARRRSLFLPILLIILGFLGLVAGRVLGAVTRDLEGWTVVTPAVDSVVVYVSAAGNDANSGLSTSLPKRTINAGYALIRTNKPDQLLLRRGDTFNETPPKLRKSGRSVAEPILYGAYTDSTTGHLNSDPRPIIVSGTGNANNAGIEISDGSGVTRVDNVVIQGWDVRTSTSNGANGLWWYCPSRAITLEDCSFRGFVQGVSGVDNFADKLAYDTTIRRCLFYANSNPNGGHTQGIYLSNYAGTFTFEENYLVENARPDSHDHQAYFDDCKDPNFSIIASRNIILGDNGSSHGMQIRDCRGEVKDNFVWRQAIGIQVGSGGISQGGGTDMDPIRPLWTRCTYNVILDSRDMSSAAADHRGWGIVVRWLDAATQSTISNNLIAGTTGTPDNAFGLLFDNASLLTNHVTVDGNVIYNTRQAVAFTDTSDGYATITFTNNKVREATTFAPLFLHTFATASTTTFDNVGGNSVYGAAPQASWAQVSGAGRSWTQWKAAVGDTTSVAAAGAAAGFTDAARTPRTAIEAAGIATTSVNDAYTKLVAAMLVQRRYNFNPGLTATVLNDSMRAGFDLPLLAATTATPPTAGAGSPQSKTDTDRSGAESFTLDGSGSSAVSPATLAGFLWKDGAATIAATQNPSVSLALGVHTLTHTVTDSGGLVSTPATVVHTVTPAAPTGMASGSITPTSAAASVTAYTSAAGYTWQYGLTTAYGSTTPTGPPSAIFSGLSPSTTYHWRVRVDAPGVSGAYSADQTFTTSAVVTHAPVAVITPGSQTVSDSTRVGTAPATLSASGSTDVDGDIASYAWKVNGSTVSTAITPTLTLPIGSNQVTLVVTDGAANTGTASSIVTVTPTTILGLAASNITKDTAAITGTAYTGATGYLFDFGTDALTDTRTVATPVLDLSGLTPDTQYRVRCTVLAGSVAGTPSALIFFRTDPVTGNALPVAVAGDDQTVVDSDRDGFATVVLDGSGSSDSDGAISLYVYSEAAARTHDIAPGGMSTPTLALGLHHFTLDVYDNAGDKSLSDGIDVTVKPAAPVGMSSTPGIGLAATGWTAYPTVGSYLFMWGDSDGVYTRSSSIAASASPSAMLTGAEGSTIHWTVAAVTTSATGSVVGEFCADQSVTLLSASSNSLPVANAGADIVASDDGSGSVLVTFDGTGSTDSDGTIASYDWTSSDGGPTPLVGSGPSATLDVGTYVYTLTVTDNDGGVGTDTVVVRVLPIVIGSVPGKVGRLRVFQYANGNGLSVEWDAIATATGYTVSWVKTSGGTPVHSATSATALNIGGLSRNTSYTITVSAFNENGTGANSDAFTGVPRRLPRRHRPKRRADRRLGQNHRARKDRTCTPSK